MLLSAAPGYEFLDWGGQAHVGGGSHGSLHAVDSLGALVLCGVELAAHSEPAQWAIRDVAPLVLAHFGLSADEPACSSARAVGVTLAWCSRWPILIACAALCCCRCRRSAAPARRIGHVAPVGAAAQPACGRSSGTASSAPVHRTRKRRCRWPASERPAVGRSCRPNGSSRSRPRCRRCARCAPKYPGSYGGAYLKGPCRWQVSFFSRNGKKEIGQVIIADASGRVLEQWTGFQVAWTMARGYPGAFGRHVNALYVWLPLCLLFLLPFVDFRRPFSLLHLDLLVLLSFSISLAFFNHAQHLRLGPARLSAAAVPAGADARAAHGDAAPRTGHLRLLVPAPWLAVGVVLPARLSHRAERDRLERDRRRLRGRDRRAADRRRQSRCTAHFPSDNEHGDTYGPVNYEAYVPFEQIFGWSGTWDDLPAAHAAAIVFDLLAVALLFLLGRRVRGPTLGIVLAYAWVAYPFTLFALESNSNDALVAVLVLAALLAASTSRRPARGAFAALAGLTKFAPLALVPLLATYGLRADPTPARAGSFAAVLRRGRSRSTIACSSRDPRPRARLAAHDL